MKTYISEKIDLFKDGKITEDDYYIEYNETVHKQCYDLLNSYWSTELQYFTENFITSSQVETEINSVSASDVFTVSGNDFNLNDQYVDVTDIENTVGIDFQNDLGITGTYYEQLTANIDTNVSANLYSMSNTLSSTSAIIINDQILFNNNISYYENEDNNKTVGKTNLMNIINNYLDINDVNFLYKTNFEISFNAVNILDYISKNDYLILLENILQTIVQKATFYNGKRRNYNYINNQLFSKISDSDIENIIPSLITDYDIDFSIAIRVVQSTNNIMKSDYDIFNDTVQKELFLSTKALIDEIDIYRNIAINEGYIK